MPAPGHDAPFRLFSKPVLSWALYELGRHHFDPTSCRVPRSREEVPLAWDLPHTELLKCRQDDDGYTGTLLCAGDEVDFMAIRDAFLDKAIDEPQPVTELPAGRDQAWPFQVSYDHTARGAGRVFWDDPGSRCSAELQTTEGDLEVALAQYASGSGS